MRFEAQVEVTHRPGILDPAGATVERALPALGWGNVSQVRIGKSIRLVIDATDEAGNRAGRRDVPAHSHESGHRGLRASPAGAVADMSVTVGVVLFPGTNC